MRVVFKQLSIVLFAFGMFYALVWLFTFVIYPDSRDYLDTYQDSAYFSNESPEFYLFGRGAGLVVRGRGMLLGGDRQVVVTGASTSVEGFRPDVMRKYMGSAVIHNLAVGASNLSQAAQVIDLVMEVVPKHQLTKMQFVIGLSYILLRPDREMWPGGMTNIDSEKLKYGMYNRDGQEQFGKVGYNLFVSLLRPILAVDAFYQRAVGDQVLGIVLYINNKWLRPMDFLITDDLNSVSVSEAYKDYVDQIMYRRMGSVNGEVGSEQFEKLIQLAKRVEKSGAKLVIVDLPVPKWHRQRSSHFASYQNKKLAYFKKLESTEAVSVLDMQFMSDDFDFYDFAHPKPMASKRWSKYLANALVNMQ